MEKTSLLPISIKSIQSLKPFVKIVHAAMKPMREAYLKMVMPSGEIYEFGNRKSSLKADIKVNDLEFFKRVVISGDIGFGEAYTDGLWDTSDITKVIRFFIQNKEVGSSISGSKKKLNLPINLFKLANRIGHHLRNNSILQSRKNISFHYDLSNELYQLFLDQSLTYSCAFFDEDHDDLYSAQQNKYHHLAHLAKITQGDEVLEIGTGWGGFALYLVKNFDCKVTTITISKQQYDYAKNLFEKEKVSDKINLKFLDYRKIQGNFDKIVSIEMLEAVGDKYFNAFFKKCNEVLKPNGLIALQVITCPHSHYPELKNSIDWTQKHIFPGSLLPSVPTLSHYLNKNGGFELYHLKEYGINYAKTLKTWRENFQSNLKQVKKLGFDEGFIRKWNYYLSYCEAAFFEKNISLNQLLYSKSNNPLTHHI
jgi:cyclopropane-fatty-acyl-phospholipid synthase